MKHIFKEYKSSSMSGISIYKICRINVHNIALLRDKKNHLSTLRYSGYYYVKLRNLYILTNNLYLQGYMKKS